MEKPGKIVRGSIHLHPAHGQGASRDLVKLVADGPEMREIQGGDIALVFQEPMTSFSPVHTVGNQIIETIQLHDRSVTKAMARDRAIELLQMVGIPRAERRVDEFAYQLSGGLRQRAMIALALACDPRLLIADEPTTGLDVTVQSQIMDLLKEIRSTMGTAIVLISHDLALIDEVCDRVVVMHAGATVEVGSVKDLEMPRHPYTIALNSSRIDVAKPGSELVTIKGNAPSVGEWNPGCRFAERCSIVQPDCRIGDHPALIGASGTHQSACIHTELLERI